MLEMFTPFIYTNKSVYSYLYCIQTLTRQSWNHYTDCWIVK